MSTQTYDDRGTGWAEFAAFVMFAVGFFRIISAIGYFADSHKINDLTNGLFSGHAWAWAMTRCWDSSAACAPGTVSRRCPKS